MNKKLTRIFCLVLCAVMVCGLLPGVVSADNLDSDEVTLNWSVSGDVLTVQGEGYVYPSTFSDVENKDQIKTVIVGQGVITINSDSFDVFPNLEKVEANTTTYMYSQPVTKFKTDDRGVLYEYDSRYDYATDTVYDFPYQLVWAPKTLSGSYTVPDSVYSIAEDFQGCYLLEELTFGAGADGPHSMYAFLGCTNLKTVNVGGHDEDDEGYLINGENGEVMHYSASAGGYMLDFIPADLTEYTIPADVATLTYSALATAPLENIYVEEGSTFFKSVDGVLYSADGTELCAFPQGRDTTSLIIPAEVTDIAKYALSNSSLTEIWFTGDVPSLSYSMFDGLVATCYYPEGTSYWNEIVLELAYIGTSLGGEITWVPYTGEPGGAPADPPVSDNPFTDVTELDYFCTPVLWAVGKGITNGYGSDDIFAPNVDCTRGQVVTFLWRAQGCPEPTITENPFADVTENDYFCKAVLWALENEITTGLSATEFGAEDICTRGQVATFLWRSAGKPMPTSSENPFQDVAETDYFYNAVLWAVEQEVTNGYGNDYTFNPSGNCNRGQIVTFLYRALN